MPIEQYTYWSVTINNPSETDYVLVRNPNDRYIRQLIWTPEVGEEGTPHIQAWLRLQRNQSMAFVKKLYPRAHVKPCDKDQYNENCNRYAQKNDDTTAGNHVITINDPLQTIETMMKKVIERMINEYGEEVELEVARKAVQKAMVVEDYRNAKFFVSATFKQMWKEYGHEMYENIFGVIQHNLEEDAKQASLQSQDDCIQGEDSGVEDDQTEETERSSESGSSCSGSPDDQSEGGEQSDW